MGEIQDDWRDFILALRGKSARLIDCAAHRKLMKVATTIYIHNTELNVAAKLCAVLNTH